MPRRDRAGREARKRWDAYLAALLQVLPHPVVDDTVAIPVRTMRDMWTRYVPFDSLPQVLNPRGGYVHNENDSPHFANVRARVNLVNAYPNIEPPTLPMMFSVNPSPYEGRQRFSLAHELAHHFGEAISPSAEEETVAESVADAVFTTTTEGIVTSWNNGAEPELVDPGVSVGSPDGNVCRMLRRMVRNPAVSTPDTGDGSLANPSVRTRTRGSSTSAPSTPEPSRSTNAPKSSATA